MAEAIRREIGDEGVADMMNLLQALAARNAAARAADAAQPIDAILEGARDLPDEATLMAMVTQLRNEMGMERFVQMMAEIRTPAAERNP